MDKHEVIRILLNEQTCVKTADTCDRDCSKCSLVIDSEKIIEAYDSAIKMLEQPTVQQWIPCSKPPKESGTYIVTAYDGINKRVSFAKYQKTLKRWDLTGSRSYWSILAYKPLPEPWKGEP